nr:MAG TPA: hypothetical protein [Caudoviricetes sp.]
MNRLNLFNKNPLGDRSLRGIILFSIKMYF